MLDELTDLRGKTVNSLHKFHSNDMDVDENDDDRTKTTGHHEMAFNAVQSVLCDSHGDGAQHRHDDDWKKSIASHLGDAHSTQHQILMAAVRSSHQVFLKQCFARLVTTCVQRWRYNMSCAKWELHAVVMSQEACMQQMHLLRIHLVTQFVSMNLREKCQTWRRHMMRDKIGLKTQASLSELSATLQAKWSQEREELVVAHLAALRELEATCTRNLSQQRTALERGAQEEARALNETIEDLS